MNSRDQSDAIWIKQQESKYSAGGIGSKSYGGFRGGQSSFDFGTATTGPGNAPSAGNPRLGFGRSMSVNSEGASTASSSSTSSGNSPPYSPIDIGSGSGRKGGLFGGGGGSRFRTSSFSAGYGPSYGGGNELDGSSDPYLIHSPLSTSAPGSKDGGGRTFRRSNSISVGALEHSHDNGTKPSSRLGQGPPLGPIDEYHKMASFGDAFKRSMDHLFSSPKIQAVGSGRFGGSGSGGVGSSATTAMSSMKEKKQNQMKDRVVSMLCESAIR